MSEFAFSEQLPLTPMPLTQSPATFSSGKHSSLSLLAHPSLWSSLGSPARHPSASSSSLSYNHLRVFIWAIVSALVASSFLQCQATRAADNSPSPWTHQIWQMWSSIVSSPLTTSPSPICPSNITTQEAMSIPSSVVQKSFWTVKRLDLKPVKKQQNKAEGRAQHVRSES